jgi:hypothetical protein
VLELLLAPAELIESLDQLLVLSLDFLQRPPRHFPRERLAEAGQAAGPKKRAPAGRSWRRTTWVPLPGADVISN